MQRKHPRLNIFCTSKGMKGWPGGAGVPKLMQLKIMKVSQQQDLLKAVHQVNPLKPQTRELCGAKRRENILKAVLYSTKIETILKALRGTLKRQKTYLHKFWIRPLAPCLHVLFIFWLPFVDIETLDACAKRSIMQHYVTRRYFLSVWSSWLIRTNLDDWMTNLHLIQALKMTPLHQFTPIFSLESTPLLLFKPVCNYGALLGGSLIKIKLKVLLRPGTLVLQFEPCWRP